MGATAINRPIGIIRFPLPSLALHTANRMHSCNKKKTAYVGNSSPLISLCMSHCVVTIHQGAAEHHGYRQTCTMKAQSHADVRELSLNDEAISLTARQRFTIIGYSPVWLAATVIHPDMK